MIFFRERDIRLVKERWYKRFWKFLFKGKFIGIERKFERSLKRHFY
ncbi:hypothetical protein MSU_0655 [Mycoplasma suis str. Illinois]|uniref:Uncharacterized protein n=1 Tax=Mycoplasma suis (strain Illinois) TaxID=768700 RepID=F0QRR6_MYCSL|nr:hypothetical protein MSU_0655 [Mycoplasma suis str. Illinois]